MAYHKQLSSLDRMKEPEENKVMKAMKKIASVGVVIAMLGATLTGAMV